MRNILGFCHTCDLVTRFYVCFLNINSSTAGFVTSAAFDYNARTLGALLLFASFAAFDETTTFRGFVSLRGLVTAGSLGALVVFGALDDFNARTLGALLLFASFAAFDETATFRGFVSLRGLVTAGSLGALVAFGALDDFNPRTLRSSENTTEHVPSKIISAIVFNRIIFRTFV